MFQDPSRIANHILDDLLGGEDFVDLCSDASGEPRSGAERVFGVLLEIVFDWKNTLLEESLGLGLAVVLPMQTNQRPD